MKHTKNYNLNKPESTDYVNIEDFNENFDAIDAELKKNKDKVDSIEVSKEEVGLGNVDNVKQASEEDFLNHKKDKSNPHNVTKKQIDLENVKNIEQASKVEFKDHADNRDNPHDVTKAQVGLENVKNVEQASKEEFDDLKEKVGNTDDLETENKESLVKSVNELEEKHAAHLAEKVHQGETHGFRLTDGKLEYFDGQEWQRVKGDGYPVGAVTDFQAKSDNASAILSWTDPNDVTVEDSNGNIITIARWKGTRILRKTVDYPQNENDGVLVVDSGVRNQYQTNGFTDTGLTNDVTYYYSAFPYTSEDVFDTKTDVSVTPTEQRIYGVRIDKNNSNPETRVTYIGDAVGFTPMRGNNGNLQWGSWEQVFNDFEIKPVVLQNKQVNYYLNPNDFTKKADGSTANITGTDGDVMIEFGKILWWKWTDEGDTYTIEISDKEFDGAVKHAFEIEEGYILTPYYPLLLTQILFVIFFKSTDSQTALGRGRVDGAGYISTGNTDGKGMFYGSESDEQMKFLGIEDYWGNKYWWIDGLVTDSNYNLLIGKGSFNDNGSGYDVHDSGVSSNTSGYIDTVQGGNDKGFIISSSSGSETTYYADHGVLYSSRVARFGGSRSHGSHAGFANLRLTYAASHSLAFIGARLFCASDGKIYIGAYLGTTVGGKLRSISGSSEPTGSKTIGAFRNEARANN